MIHLEYPWLLAGIPLVLVAFFITRHWVRTRGITHPKIRSLFGEDGDRPARLGSGLIGTVGLCFMLVALSRPQWGELEIKTYEKARQVIIGLDLSRSMLADDVSPSRLDRARMLISTLLRELRGERVGLVVFAGTAFVQMPLTSDYEIMREFLKGLNPNFLPEQGTNFGALLSTARSAFDLKSSADKFLIVLSDGEDVVGNWRPEMEKLQRDGVRVITLGLATAEGALLPDGQGGFIKDESGAVVLSKLDETVLRELAETTGGVYQPAQAWVDLRDLIERTIAQGQAGRFEENRRVARIERFQIPLGAALLFLFLSLWLDFPVQPSKRKLHLEGSIQEPRLRKGPPKPLVTVQPTTSVAGTASSTNILAGILAFALGVFAVPGQAQQGEAGPPLPDLAGVVGQLAAQPNLSAQDCAKLAETTISYGQSVLGSKGKLSPGIVRDGLEAVDFGELRDPTAADWPELRRRLEELLKEAEQPPQDSDDQKENQPPSSQEQNQKDEKQDGANSEKDQNQKGGQQKGGEQQGDPQDSAPNQDGSDSSQSQSGQKPSDATQDPSSSGGSSNESSNEPKEKAPNQAGAEDQAQNPPRPAEEPQNTKTPTDPSDTQEIGGGSTAAKANPRENVPAELQALMGRLDQLRENDAPGKIHQLFAPESQSDQPIRKTW
ncbi:MAG: hypothetical protein OHK005_19470 [Candidatus Methylacidiphilales bacterium]